MADEGSPPMRDPEPYLAAEDSALLREALKPFAGGSFLEIGTGNGGNLVAQTGKFERLVGTDLARPSMGDWSEAGADIVLTDGAACVRDACFDLVAFNPPYLRGKGADIAVEGGKGLEVPMGFLREALRVAKGSGKVVFLVNDESSELELARECSRAGFGLRLLRSRRVFFEELRVYEASRMSRSTS